MERQIASLHYQVEGQKKHSRSYYTGQLAPDLKLTYVELAVIFYTKVLPLPHRPSALMLRELNDFVEEQSGAEIGKCIIHANYGLRAKNSLGNYPNALIQAQFYAQIPDSSGGNSSGFALAQIMTSQEKITLIAQKIETMLHELQTLDRKGYVKLTADHREELKRKPILHRKFAESENSSGRGI